MALTRRKPALTVKLGLTVKLSISMTVDGVEVLSKYISGHCGAKGAGFTCESP